jgi:hypothetical protein
LWADKAGTQVARAAGEAREVAEVTEAALTAAVAAAEAREVAEAASMAAAAAREAAQSAALAAGKGEAEALEAGLAAASAPNLVGRAEKSVASLHRASSSQQRTAPLCSTRASCGRDRRLSWHAAWKSSARRASSASRDGIRGIGGRWARRSSKGRSALTALPTWARPSVCCRLVA